MIKGLYETFAERWWHQGGNIWLISDPHFNDPEMPFVRKNYIGDEELVRRINSKAGKKDTLIILGDVGDIEYVKKLKAGYKILIMGNHDKGVSNYKREHEEEFDHTGQYEDDPKEFDEMKRNGWVIEAEHFTKCYSDSYAIVDAVLWKKVKDNHLFDEVYEGALMIGPKLILSHEPIPNLPPWLFNIHGHDHSNWFTGSRHLNVCAEHIGYTPICLSSIIRDGLLKDVENIHRITIDGAIERKAKRKK